MGVVQAPAGCGESCGLPMPAGGSCVISAGRPVNPVKNWENIGSDSKTMVGGG